MFERLTDRFQDVFRKLTGRGTLTEANVEEAMQEVRRALLEADVNYAVANEFVGNVRAKCLGQAVLKSLAPGQQAVKVVNDELTALLGEATAPLDLEGRPAVIMLVGLHGSGKTTTAAKLAHLLQTKEERKVLLVAGDLYRPAAIEQLESLGADLGVPVHVERDSSDVARLAVNARNKAQALGADVVIIDTAGRLQIDTDLVQELVEVKRRAQPREILLVADAALGQESVSVAEHFDQALGLTGIILTKLDGDARGGAALSMRHVTGRPIKYVGIGERTIDLEPFYPDRMASRILGMGDVVSLVEKASEQYEEEEALELEEKMRKSTFNFEDFLDQLKRLQKMGGLMSMLDFLPGAGKLKQNVDIDESQLRRVQGIIHSMTVEERRRPEIIGLSRRRRIARGSGVELLEVNQLIKRFESMRQMMSKLTRMDAMGDGMGGGALGGKGGRATNVQKTRPKRQKPKRPKKRKKRR